MRFWPVCVKGKDEESSQSQKCMETFSLATFCMRIKEMWLVHQNSSILRQKGAAVCFRPVSVIGGNEGS